MTVFKYPARRVILFSHVNSLSPADADQCDFRFDLFFSFSFRFRFKNIFRFSFVLVLQYFFLSVLVFI